MKYLVAMGLVGVVFGLGWGFKFGTYACERHFEVGDYARNR